jgi:DeoR/GlpR family transcriptional regulator of sugar metabolism
VGRRAFARICPLEKVDVLVTDRSLDAAAHERLTDAGVTVQTV